MKTKTTKAKLPALQFFPYIPGRPEWKQVPWDKARAIRPDIGQFVGHDGNGNFYFQVRGDKQAVIVQL